VTVEGRTSAVCTARLESKAHQRRPSWSI